MAGNSLRMQSSRLWMHRTDRLYTCCGEDRHRARYRCWPIQSIWSWQHRIQAHCLRTGDFSDAGISAGQMSFYRRMVWNRLTGRSRIYKKTDGVLSSEKTSEMRSAQTPKASGLLWKNLSSIKNLFPFHLWVYCNSNMWIKYEQLLNNYKFLCKTTEMVLKN